MAKIPEQLCCVADSDDDLFGEPNLQACSSIAAAAAVSPKKVKTEALTCWLCTQPGATCKWWQLDLHTACANALRCHRRCVGDDRKDIENDQEWRLEDPESYREYVLPLVVVGETGKRDKKLLQDHREGIAQTFKKVSTTKTTELLTKSRFISRVMRDENYSWSDASSSFERRLEDASSEHCDSDDSAEPRVKWKGNRRIEDESGRLTTVHAPGSSSGCLADQRRQRGRSPRRNRRARGQEAAAASVSDLTCERSRSTHRGVHGRRSTAEPAALPKTQSSTAPRVSPVSSPGGRASSAAGAASQLPRRRCSSKTLGSRGSSAGPIATSRRPGSRPRRPVRAKAVAAAADDATEQQENASIIHMKQVS